MSANFSLGLAQLFVTRNHMLSLSKHEPSNPELEDMKKKGARSPSQRQLRVGEELRHVLAETLEKGEVHDPGVADISVTVSEVRVGADLRHAVVYVAPLGGGDGVTMIAALERARPFLRHRLAQQVRLKFVPDLAFRLDTSFDYAAQIDDLLRRVIRPETAHSPEHPSDPSEDRD